MTVIERNEITAPKRMSLTLDPVVAIERVMLIRWLSQRPSRRQHWLRSMLIQGFLADARWLHVATAPDKTIRLEPPTLPETGAPFAEYLSRARPTNARAFVRPTQSRESRTAQSVPAISGEKRFSHLGKVIG